MATEKLARSLLLVFLTLQTGTSCSLPQSHRVPDFNYRSDRSTFEQGDEDPAMVYLGNPAGNVIFARRLKGIAAYRVFRRAVDGSDEFELVANVPTPWVPWWWNQGYENGLIWRDDASSSTEVDYRIHGVDGAGMLVYEFPTIVAAPDDCGSHCPGP